MSRRSLAVATLVALMLTATVETRAQEPAQPTLKARHADTRVAGRPAEPRSLTAAKPGEPLAIALEYLAAHAPELGFTPADLEDALVTSQYTSEHSGVTHIYLRQRDSGLEIHGADININVTKDGQVLSAGSSFVASPRAAARPEAASRNAVESAESAARHLGVELRRAIGTMRDSGDRDRGAMLSDGGISRRPIPARLVYEPIGSGELALAWLVEIDQTDADHWWSLTVDATTGEVLDQVDHTVHDVWDVSADAPAAVASGAPVAAPIADAHPRILSAEGVPPSAGGVPNSGTFRVHAWPKSDPNDGPREIEINPANPNASPFGWHDTNGIDGAESTLTTGNNVDAYTDINNNNNGNAPDSRADGGPGLVFDFAADLAVNPITYRQAAITNLFYWNNLMHDISYQYGFNEPAGNLQTNQYGKFNAGANDRVNAEAQDGGGMNNANFSTPVDGSSGRMQMYIWLPPGGYQLQLGTGTNLSTVRANFGAFLSDVFVTQPIAEIQTAGNACTAATFAGFVPGRIAFANTSGGGCSSVTKAVNAQTAGASGIIINAGVTSANLEILTGVTPVNAAGNPTLTIPVLGVSTTTAASLLAALPATAKMAFLGTPAPLRDGDFDALVIAHEYTHGISNRLTGGRLNVSCLNNNEQMGEGWSDWIALTFTHDPLRPVQRTRGLGPYIRFTGVDGAGIRPTRYSPDMAINPTTYDDIKTLAVPHGVGYAWASMLWEMYWNLIDKHGFNPVVYDPWFTGGNNLAIQLVMDGMKLQPCRPGFVSGRNAILQADQVLTGGANQCLIWKSFAKRGLGFSATEGSTNSVADGVEAFDLPASCLAGATIAPPSFSATLECSAVASKPLTIHNTSAADGTDLTWSLAKTATDCATPGDLPWVTATPASGTTAPGADSTVALTFNAAGFDVGSVNGQVCVASNAPDSPRAVELALTIVDTTPPSVAAPAGLTLETTPMSCTVVVPDAMLGTGTGGDNCAAGATIARTGVPADNVFPVGDTTITYTATDAVGLTTSSTQTITIVDATSPAIVGPFVSPSTLWPPNHKMVDVAITYRASDNCKPVSIALDVTSNEPQNGLGDGDTDVDWEIVNTNRVRLRAERSGQGSGRVYTITIKATDASGNVSTESVKVRVPHDKGK